MQRCCEGPALARGEALASLTAGQLLALFPESCGSCGANHRIGAENLARAYRAILPTARAAAAMLGARHLIALATVRGDNAEETAQRQALHAAALRAGLKRQHRSAGSPPPSAPLEGPARPPAGPGLAKCEGRAMDRHRAA